MNTEKQWFDHPTRAVEFRAIVNEPAFIDALEVLTGIGLLPIAPPEGTTFSLMEFHALSNRWREGYLQCLANLKILANPKPVKMPEKAAWKSSDEVYAKAKKEAETLEPITVTFTKE